LAAKTLQTSENSSTASATEEQSESRSRVRLSVASLILESAGRAAILFLRQLERSVAASW